MSELNQILIIDDEQTFVDLLKIRLESILAKPKIMTFNSLADVEKYLNDNETEFDLVVIDQHLPDGKGSDFIKKGYFGASAILSMSSDEAPEIPAQSIGAGATFFLNKKDLSAPLFDPLIHGLIQRNQLARALNRANMKLTKLDTVKKMVSTLRHEINNPLAAIFGAIFILKRRLEEGTEDYQAAELLDDSSHKIKDILENFENATEVEDTEFASQSLIQVPDTDSKE